MEKIGLILSDGIKRGKWIYISYKNVNGELTYYWIAVKDIDLKSQKLFVLMFNDQKSLNVISGTIDFNRIVSAKVLDFTSFDTPRNLIDKIENNSLEAEWLGYDSFNNNILRYYLRCNVLDNDPFQKDSFLIDGIDKDVLLKDKRIILNDFQEKQVLNYIKEYDVKKSKGEVNYLILSCLSIDDNDKKYVILYYDVVFNPLNKILSINDTLRVNQSFLIENKRHSINSYIDIDPSEFVFNITNHLDEYLEDYTELIRSNLHGSEVINQMPEFMIMKRCVSANLEPTYDLIEKKFESGDLERPMKAFFGNSNRLGSRRSEPSIVIYDDKVNIDQMRVIYSTLKNPITYVQGPPGTGKTQTILNVILSAFFNSNTVLICSSNNKPIDGILEKLSFSYKDNGDVPFPYLRLGNKAEVARSTLRILDLYNFKASSVFADGSLHEIKESLKKGNKDLVRCLENYEEKKDLESRIECARKLIDSISNSSSHLYKNVLSQISELERDFDKISLVSNEDVLKLVKSVSEDAWFKKFLYFESVRYIRKLKNPRYAHLIEICKIKDEDERVRTFNNWCFFDDNIKLLEDVFPIIITTNISSSRLGTANHTFDLVIMDEAGQCNCAVALLPIARAKKLLLVGDTNQLKPVVLLEDAINEYLMDAYSISPDYDYCRFSILDIMRMHDNVSKDIMLTYHYRCGRKIINFSNERFYDGKLNLDYLSNEGNLSLIDVKNVNSKLRNENYEEALAIVEYVKRNNLKDVSIITPFKNQQNLINSMLKEEGITDVSSGTIHQIQGGEKDTIIISSSISPKTSKRTFEWIKNNSEITNVAVTRAKKNLIVVADTEALDKLSIDKTDDLSNLVRYIKSNGKVIVPPNESYSIQIGRSNGSKNEDVFFKTISHFCSVNNNFQAKRNVLVSSLFPSDSILSKSNLEFDIVLYEVDGIDLIPRIAIEVQGGEHFGDVFREKCDVRKSKVCSLNRITLLEIPNSFIKSYETIKELILASCGVQSEQLELF